MLSMPTKDSSCRTGSIELPEEILDLIMDELKSIRSPQGPSQQEPLESQGRIALRTCIFVSKLFRGYALARLFNQVTISNECLGRDNNRLALLHQVVKPLSFRSTLGGVGPYIKQIIFRFTAGPLEYADLVSRPLQLHWDRSVDIDLNTFFARRELVMLINELNQKEYGVRHLSLDLSSTLRGQRWPKFPQNLQKAIQSLVLSPHLTSLDIRGIAQLPPTFLEGSNVTDLRLQAFSDHVDFLNSRFIAEGLMVTPPDLRTLYTDNTYQYQNPSKLKVLTAHSGLGNFQTTLSIIKASSSLLEHLHIIYHDKSEIFLKLHPGFRVDLLPHLKSFKYHQYLTNQVTPRRPLDLFCQILDASKSMNLLEEIDLQLVFTHVGLNGYLIEDDPGWQKLNVILSQQTPYPVLDRLALTIFMHIDKDARGLFEDSYCPGLARVIAEKSLSRLSRTKTLVIDVRSI